MEEEQGMKRLKLIMLGLLLTSTLAGPAYAQGADDQAVKKVIAKQSTIGQAQGTAYQQVRLAPRGSERYVVWTERKITDQPGGEDYFASHDIYALDRSSGQQIVVANGPNNQMKPAISGSVVVWQDDAHSCAGCERDILGKDLVSGATFTVANGLADQTEAAIFGRDVAWIEFDGKNERLLLKNLDSGELTTLASAAASSGITFKGAAISDQYIVWAEVQPYQGDKMVHAQLQAYDRTTGQRRPIADTYQLGGYALADHRLVWADLQLRFADLPSTRSIT